MIYLDNAATTRRKPKSVFNAVRDELKHAANPGRSGHNCSLKSSERIYNVRKLLGDLFHIEKIENIILTPNATYALNFGIKGVLHETDHVITTSMEHNSVLRPLHALPGISVTRVQADREGFVSPADIEAAIRPETRLIAVNHSSNVTGSIQQIDAIGKIARKHQILFLVDASQTAGIVPIDVEASCIDLMGFPGHKGLYGPQGTGGLYIRPGLELKTLIEGGTGSASSRPENPDFLPDKFESGTLNTPGFHGLSKGVEYVLRTGVDNILAYERSLLRQMKEAFLQMKGVTVYGPTDSNRQTGTLCLNVNHRDSSEIANRLNDEFGIAVRAGFHCAYPAHQTIGTEKTGAVRISVSDFTRPREIKRLIHAVYRMTKEP